MTSPTENRSAKVREFTQSGDWNMARTIAAVVAIAAAYIYFLIFAQFAFVKLVQAEGLTQGAMRIVMGCMGIAGISASLGAGRLFRAESGARRAGLMTGFVGCGFAAFLAVSARGLLMHGIVAAAIGVFLGMLTVNLASGIPFLFGHGLVAKHRGLCVGIATGAAYAICNIPSVFAGTPQLQTLLAGGACIAGILASSYLKDAPLPDDGRVLNVNGLPLGVGNNYAFGCMIAIFLSLVWLDSAAFNILQSTPELNQFGWGNAALQWKNAGVHLSVAIFAGILLDRGLLHRLLLVAFVALGSAAVCVSTLTPAAVMTHWLYAAGVSLYSTALVFAPTADRRVGISQSAMRAGILYAVAGWAGSALGIGMVQDLHRIPLWFLVLAGAVVLSCSGSLAGFGWPHFVRRTAFIAGITIPIFLISQASGNRGITSINGAGDAAAGREVYISEGCLNCHTQFVRQGTADELWWGPAANPESILKQAPPLIGNRRQGPDLMNIGNRRSPAWNRIHLIDPSALSPGSRMPSYAYLFAPGESRGDALVTYLASLGESTFDQRTATCLNWHPAPGTRPGIRSAQAGLFQHSCAQCHGALGRGDGPLASSIGPVAPRNLTLGLWRFFAHDSRSPTLDLARTIKFGVAGTSMPGHEIFSDSEILGLAEYVQSLKPLTSTIRITP